MVHWELIGHAITDPDELDLSDIRDSHGIWAPDISYSNGRFIKWQLFVKMQMESVIIMLCAVR